jgi:predicted nucleotide-binding protein (sugar kinase/HSP70/actin superfamily)
MPPHICPHRTISPSPHPPATASPRPRVAPSPCLPLSASPRPLHPASPRPIVGIPRGLLYFHYQPLWSTFLTHLGVVVRTSEPTERAHLERAQSLTRSDLCLPVKVFLEHVARLQGQVDWLLLPRITSVVGDAFMCPKILGLTDMVRNVFDRLPGLLDPKVNVKAPRPQTMDDALIRVGRYFSASPERLDEALDAAHRAQAEYHRRLLHYPLDEALAPWDGPCRSGDAQAAPPPLYRVAVIGRSYINFDPALSHRLLELLRRHQVRVCTPENLPREVKDRESARLRKQVYWQLGRDLVAAAMHYADHPEIDGIINVSSFGCGQDSFTTALVEHYISHSADKPMLSLVLDEHSGDAGLQTRVEAFLDMLEHRKRRAGNRSVASRDEALPASRPPSIQPTREIPQAGRMHLTIPHMGHLHLGFERVFRNLGVHISMPPRPNKEALLLGTRYAPECACLPFKLNLGNMIQALEAGATDIIMPGGFGPCRFGYYSVVQEQILRDLGYQFRMGSADNPDSLRDMLATIKMIAGLNTKWDSYRVFLLILYRIAAADWALLRAHWLRPRELERRATDQALRRGLRIIEESRGFRGLWWAWQRVRRLMAEVPVEPQRPVVRVGVVGEIFMVLENHANMNVEERLGEMGVEVQRGLWLSDWLNDRFRFMPWRRNQFRWSLRQAAPYLYDPSGGESVKSVGKSAHFARQRFDGIVHLMPFTCMPELVAQTILARISTDFDIPVLTLIFDEHTSPGAVQTRLEAFVDLIKRGR